VTESFALDPGAPVPLYAQLHAHLRQAILSGRYGEGEAIPSETELHLAHGITRGTVRQATALLAQQGLVRRVRGKGTIVTFDRSAVTLWSLGGFTDWLTARGAAGRTRVLTHAVEADAAGAAWLHLVRLRGLQDGASARWLYLDDSRLRLLRFPGLDRFDFSARSLYATLRDEYGVVPAQADIRLHVVARTASLDEAFGVADDVPALIGVTGTVFTAAGEPVEETSVVYSPGLELRVGQLQSFAPWEAP
jgi:GntR family transcriptional regulator